MKVRMAHLREQGIDFAVFDARRRLTSRSAKSDLLTRLTGEARRQGLSVEKSALAYVESGRLVFFGVPDLVSWLSVNGVPIWTHTLTLH